MFNLVVNYSKPVFTFNMLSNGDFFIYMKDLYKKVSDYSDDQYNAFKIADTIFPEVTLSPEAPVVPVKSLTITVEV